MATSPLGNPSHRCECQEALATKDSVVNIGRQGLYALRVYAGIVQHDPCDWCKLRAPWASFAVKNSLLGPRGLRTPTV